MSAALVQDADGWRLCFDAMACGAELRLDGLDGPQADTALRAARHEVQRIEARYSRYRADSVVSRINATAGTGRPCAVDAETAQLLDFADRLHAESGGLFDISSGVLRRAWDFRVARLPDPASLQDLLAQVGWHKLQWNSTTRELMLPHAGMELDFGGFGKEYAADRAATVLIEHGARHGYVNLGGDIRVIGPRRDGKPWRFGIQHPRAAQGIIAELMLTHGALATSGDYERYFELDGQRYCHILDPRSGWPVQHWQSISVTAPLCIAAGALTTIAMLKQSAALEFLQTQGVEYLAIDAAGRLHRPN